MDLSGGVARIGNDREPEKDRLQKGMTRAQILRRLLPGTWQIEEGNGRSVDHTIATLKSDGTFQVRGIGVPFSWYLTDSGEVKIAFPKGAVHHIDFSEIEPDRLVGIGRRVRGDRVEGGILLALVASIKESASAEPYHAIWTRM